MIWPLLRASDLSVTPENGRIGIANKTIVKKLSFAPAVSEGGWRRPGTSSARRSKS